MRQAVLWAVVLATAGSLLVLADFRSRDPDSALYARLAADLAKQPVSRWIAPEWGGAWNQQGLFREHPVGILLPSVLLIRAGYPSDQAAYAVNMVYQAAVIFLIPLVAALLVADTEARALAWILQLIPLSFVYRIRANQEHPLLMCFLALIYATHRARARSGWIVVMTASFCFLVLVKGAFAMFALIAAALWILIVPAPAGGSNRAGWAGLAVTAMSALVIAAGYEAIYVRTTGESFVDFYRTTRLGESMSLSDPRVIPHALVNAGWYVGRLAWFAAPWSLPAFAAIWVWLQSKVTRQTALRFDRPSDRALLWAFLVGAIFIAALSPANVRAERFIFPVYFIVASVGVVTAMRRIDGVRWFVQSTGRHWWLPAATWFAMFLLSLGSRILR